MVETSVKDNGAPWIKPSFPIGPQALEKLEEEILEEKYLSRNTRGGGGGSMFAWIGEAQYDAVSSDSSTGLYTNYIGTATWTQYILKYQASSVTTFVAFGSLASGPRGPALDAIELLDINYVA
jgi:hypothetical protein